MDMQSHPTAAEPLTFDPESPDAAIFAAYERFRQLKRFSYTDDPDGTRWSDEQEALHYDELDKAEDVILRSTACTPTGVAVRLALALPQMEQSGWVDRGLADHGIAAMYHARDRLENGTDRETITAAFELLQIEWQQALADYRRAELDFDLVLKIKSAVDAENYRLRAEGAAPSDQFSLILERVEEVEGHFCNSVAIDRLMRTLAPDFDAYRLKAEIAIAEGYTSEAAAWLLRDVNVLMGAIEPETMEKAA